jgi:hypothetical protein
MFPLRPVIYEAFFRLFAAAMQQMSVIESFSAPHSPNRGVCRNIKAAAIS